MRPWRHQAEIIAHRGASAVAPENTLAAIDLAWQWFADAVEIDVHVTKDQRVVAIHDDSLLRTCGVDVKVKDLTLAELRDFDVGNWKNFSWANEVVPTLSEVLASIPQHRRLYVELKCGPEILDALPPVLNLIKHVPESVVMISFDSDLLAAVKQRFPQHRALHVVEQQQTANGTWSPSAAEIIDHCRSRGFDGADLSNTEAITREAIDQFKAVGLATCVWTVNTIEDARRLIEAGVDGITTDHPKLLDKPKRRYL
jgi:glycerophosphoryl diester phosphodiesterase